MLSCPDSDIVVIDIETTPIQYDNYEFRYPEPIEIAAIHLDREFNVLGKIEFFVKPSNLEQVDDFTTSLTGIAREQLENERFFEDCWRELVEFTKFNKYRLFSWGSYFDYSVLKIQYVKIGLDWPHSKPILDIPSFVYALASIYGLNIKGLSLNKVCDYFEIEKEVKHRAYSGAYRAVLILRKMFEMTL